MFLLILIFLVVRIEIIHKDPLVLVLKVILIFLVVGIDTYVKEHCWATDTTREFLRFYFKM